LAELLRAGVSWLRGIYNRTWCYVERLRWPKSVPATCILGVRNAEKDFDAIASETLIGDAGFVIVSCGRRKGSCSQ